jgi:hypothetical protein
VVFVAARLAGGGFSHELGFERGNIEPISTFAAELIVKGERIVTMTRRKKISESAESGEWDSLSGMWDSLGGFR